MRSASIGDGNGSEQSGIHAAMDLLGQRWTMRVIWELEPGPLGFLELRRRMGNCSSSVLADRLVTLAAAQVVEKQTDRTYRITTTGQSLAQALDHVWKWADDNSRTLSGSSTTGLHSRRRK